MMMFPERYRETSVEATKFSWRWRSTPALRTAWDFDEIFHEIEGCQSNASVLLDGCKLAKKPSQPLETQVGREDKRKWQLTTQAWVEMLTCAAVSLWIERPCSNTHLRCGANRFDST